MSIQAIVWVIEHSESRLADRCVLLSIANHCDRLGKNAWPSVHTIGHEARVSPRQVQVSVARLSKTQELNVARNQGPHGTNLYRLPMMTEGDPALLAKVPEAERGGAESAGAQNLRAARSASGAKNPASKHQNFAPEPSLKPSSPTPSAPIPKAESASSKLAQPPPLSDGALIPIPDPWALVKNELKETINRQSFETWILPMRLGYARGRTLVVQVPTVAWEYAREQFGTAIQEAINRLQLPYDEFAILPENGSHAGPQHRGGGKRPPQQR